MLWSVAGASDGQASRCHALAGRARAPIADTDETTTAFLQAADHLERWAESLPRWSEASQEPWYEFVERRYEAEMALIERLRRASTCRLKVCPPRQYVDLTLGGISVSTDQGLAAACREWARRARARPERRGASVEERDTSSTT